MDYEKAYKEALNRAREIHRNEDEKRFDMEWLFPELKESEDEMIRKELIRETKGSEERLFEAVTNEEFVAWLEKQGEQKPTEWSEEDENRFQNIIACIEDCYNEKDAQDLIRWFNNSLIHQPKPVWSNADIKILQLVIDGYQNTEDFSKVDGVFVDWLKSLKNRIQGKEEQ